MSDQATAVAQDEQPGSAEKPKRPKHINLREKIRAANLLERLERNAMGELDPPMTTQQIKSAEIALKKCIPDLQAITIKGEEGGDPISFVHRLELVAPSLDGHQKD